VRHTARLSWRGPRTQPSPNVGSRAGRRVNKRWNDGTRFKLSTNDSTRPWGLWPADPTWPDRWTFWKHIWPRVRNWYTSAQISDDKTQLKLQTADKKINFSCRTPPKRELFAICNTKKQKCANSPSKLAHQSLFFSTSTAYARIPRNIGGLLRNSNCDITEWRRIMTSDLSMKSDENCGFRHYRKTSMEAKDTSCWERLRIRFPFTDVGEIRA